MNKPSPFQIEFLPRPGRRLSDGQIERLGRELIDIADTCFDEVPAYQCLEGTRDALADKVVTVARAADGTAHGFSSALLIPVPGLGEVFHMGLTCVRPEGRGAGLTHKLMSRAVIQYLLTHRPFGKLWVSNCACVLSSLGNVALHFEDIYPSPFGPSRPSEAHRQIAAAIDARYRQAIYIRDDATFDDEAFVYRGSVRDTMFQKDGDDRRYFHRNGDLNAFYSGRMDFRNGDEVLQVGYASLWAGIKYKLGGKKKPRTPDRVEHRPPAGLAMPGLSAS